MKKFSCILLSLILLLSFTSVAFADEVHLLDPISGEIVDENGNSSSTIKLSLKCKYDITDKMYIYSTGSTSSTDVACSVYNGMIVTDPVVIRPSKSAKIEVYRGSQLVDPSEYENLSEPGSYVVNDLYQSQELLSFTIVPYVTSAISSYSVPMAFYISSAKCNDEDINVVGNTVQFDKDGIYHIEYVGKLNNVGYTLDVNVDITYPELEIIGVDEDGVARGPVSFGPLEAGSTLSVTVDGQEVQTLSGQYSTAGQYVVKYTDSAGNVSSYYFRMVLFFNLSAGLFITLLGVIIVLAVGFVIYTHKNRKVR